MRKWGGVLFGSKSGPGGGNIVCRFHRQPLTDLGNGISSFNFEICSTNEAYKHKSYPCPRHTPTCRWHATCINSTFLELGCAFFWGGSQGRPFWVFSVCRLLSIQVCSMVHRWPCDDGFPRAARGRSVPSRSTFSSAIRRPSGRRCL